MNWRHFSAFLWLRWRIRLHQLKRAGIVNAVITFILLGSLIPLALGLFVGTFCAGAFAVPQIPEARLSTILTYIWDGIAVVFLFAWMAGLLTELQRAEALSLQQFLHLPVSLSGVFVINYLSSLLSFNMAVFVPAMVGFILGLSVGVNVLMLLLLPLLAAFLFAVTALSYQFQGWLATLMSNPRRRRTIIVTVSMVAILMCQVPNLINMTQPWRHADQAQPASDAEAAILGHRVEAGVALLNYAVPPLWLALGAGAAAEWNPLPAILGTLGLGLVGAGGLWRAYRTTVRIYTGVYTATARPAPAPVAKPAPPAAARSSRRTFLEWQVPWFSERVSAIALATFRSVLRAPETRMQLLTPLLMGLFFGAMILSGQIDPPPMARPLMGCGAMAILLLGMAQLIGNQFGFDRHGFRVFVLGPAPRRDVLIGRNLAYAPITLGLGYLLIGVLEILLPMRPDHFVLVLLQAIAMYLLYSLLANLVSILAPMPVAANSLRPVKPGGLVLLVHMGQLMFFPLMMLPVLPPLGLDLLLGWLEWPWLPAGLVLMALELVLVALLYRVAIGWEGKLLHAREQKILEVVSAKAE